ncbi:hypothetical protein C1646_775853 [Rhizophagus diaphanus]|nr:hypothetical protein C1646_775853 [Rhizophagus diaphanus] [Rhizophagus sp. MUCL 43196]
MGTGWVILNDKEEVISKCSSLITEWSSSTHAKLGAILSAILVLQIGQRVWCNTNNYSIISSIINLIDSKPLRNQSNEEADRVVKNDMERLTCIRIKDSQQKDLKYDLYWDDKKVDRYIRKFINNICETVLKAA